VRDLAGEGYDIVLLYWRKQTQINGTDSAIFVRKFLINGLHRGIRATNVFVFQSQLLILF
jgi:hypothetical protein